MPVGRESFDPVQGWGLAPWPGSLTPVLAWAFFLNTGICARPPSRAGGENADLMEGKGGDMSLRRRYSVAMGFLVLALLSGTGPVTAGDLTPGRLDMTLESKVYSSDGADRDQFSSSADIGGDSMISSAREDDDVGENSGSAYLFERDPVTGEWSQTWKFVAFDGLEHDYYGESAAIAGDVVAIGTDRRRAVYVYHRDLGGPNMWGLAVKLEPDGPGSATEFGWEVDIDDDATRMVVAARGKPGGAPGLAYVFDKDPMDNWVEVAVVAPSDGVSGDAFGTMVSLDPGGDRFLIGADSDDGRVGSAYIYELDELGDWIEAAKLTASDGTAGDFFGRVVALDGNIAVVGAPEDSDIAPRAGSSYVFERDELGQWSETAKLVPLDPEEKDFFGRCVAVRGDLVGVAAPGADDLGDVSGAAYFFRRNEGGPGAWGQTRKLTADDSITRSRFAYAVAFDAERMVIGADFDSNEVGEQTGSAYVYDLLEGPASAVSGSCPGTATIELSGVTPGGRVLLMRGQVEGEFMVPAGRPCEGTTLDLALPRKLGVVTADANGDAIFTRPVQGPFCGKPVQGFDLTTCGVTAVASIP